MRGLNMKLLIILMKVLLTNVVYSSDISSMVLWTRGLSPHCVPSFIMRSTYIIGLTDNVRGDGGPWG